MALGRKTGGRQKGTVNKVTAARIDAQRAMGLMPLDYMLDVLRNPESEPEQKRWAANAAAPYLHARLAQTEIRVPEKVVHEVRVIIATP